jgi:hypothetical protein
MGRFFLSLLNNITLLRYEVKTSFDMTRSRAEKRSFDKLNCTDDSERVVLNEIVVNKQPKPDDINDKCQQNRFKLFEFDIEMSLE